MGLRCTVIIMAQVKCTKCGQLFNDDTLNACPKCGCPASECVSIHNETNVDSSEKTSEAEATVRKDLKTTDTGYEHEKVIQRYATFLFWLIIVIHALWWIGTMVVFGSSEYTQDMVGRVFLAGLFLLPLTILVAYIIRAFFMIYANMSINLHELNMKLQCKN